MMKAILPGFYTFTGLVVGRVYMSEDPDGITIIDTGLELAADRILNQLSAAGRKPTDVKRILITHAHPDHIGGLPKLKAATGAEVICSVGERPVVEGKIPIPRLPPEGMPGIWRLMPMKPQTVKGTPVDRELMEGDVLPEVMGGLHVISTPGHAPDHISFWQPERKLVIIGDVMMRLFGRILLPIAAFTVDMDEDKRSVAKLAGYDARVVCFGHGAPITQNAAEVIRAFARKVGVL
jgi:glyoxylase-like metal-dependent hydrolase (beta-lactamase superfamily II)